MEFKNFEDKLIIEKLTNYCIENNISANEINDLTAKIKFGRLDENVLSEFIDPFSLGVAASAGTGAAIGGAVKGAKWLYDKIGGGITSTQKYNYAIKTIQQNLQNAMDSLNAAHKNLSGSENIFDKYKIVMPEDKKQDLINAVTQLKTAIDQYTPDVKTSLQNVGGQVSGDSNFGDTSPINFDILFPELKKDATLDVKWKANFPNALPELNRIKSSIKKNIIASLKDKDPSQINALVQKFKQSINKSIESLTVAVGDDGLSNPNPKLAQEAYAELLSLSQGRFPTSTSTSTGTTPSPIITPEQKKKLLDLILNYNTYLNNNVENIIRSTTKVRNDYYLLMNDIIKANKNDSKILKPVWNDIIDNNPKAQEGSTDTQYERTAAQILSNFRDQLGL